MGREGVAFTFVTTEEGGELTRIEILINRLLKRDEIEGFSAVSTPVPLPAALAGGSPPTPGSPEAADGEPPKPRKTPPGQRPRKRHRRGL
jgi:ATP-dependent RNA helicase DeaD